jgi:hypothetical protein
LQAIGVADVRRLRGLSSVAVIDDDDFRTRMALLLEELDRAAASLRFQVDMMSTKDRLRLLWKFSVYLIFGWLWRA